MDYTQALQRLRNHANISGSDLPESESLLFVLWQAGRQAHIPETDSLFDDIFACLETVNHALNTKHPSETITGKAEALPRSLVADISVILSAGWSYYWRWSRTKQFSEAFCGEFAGMLVRLSIAWNAVLDGDIDDIRSHAQEEFLAGDYTF
jgi:hypothetical protein